MAGGECDPGAASSELRLSPVAGRVRAVPGHRLRICKPMQLDESSTRATRAEGRAPRLVLLEAERVGLPP